MAIRVRKGLKEQLIQSKLLPGEFAVATDTGSGWYCYAAGKVKLIATSNDIETLRQELSTYKDAQEIIVDRLQQAINTNTSNITKDEKAILQSQKDIGTLQSGLAETKSELAGVKSEVTGEINAELDAIDSRISALQSDLTALDSETTTSLGTINAGIAGINSNIGTLRSDLAALDSETAESLKTVNEGLTHTNESVGRLDTDMGKAKSDIETIQSNLTALDGETAASLEVVNAGLTETKSGIRAIQIDLTTLANAMDGAIIQTNIDVTAVKDNVSEVQLLIDEKIDGAYVEDGYLYMTSDNEIVAGPLGPFSGSGGGGGTGNNAVLTVSNTSGWLSKSIASGAECKISLTWTSLEDDLPTGNGAIKVTINGLVKTTQDAAQGSVTLDISKYLAVGANRIKINVTDIYGNSRTVNYSVSVVEVSISSNFDASIPYTGEIAYTYTPVGSVLKKMHFVLDGKEIGTTQISVSGRQQSYTIPGQKHGAHSLLVYFTADMEGVEVKSNELYYDLICTENGNMAPIIVSNFRTMETKQYTAVSIAYQVYNPASMSSEITLSANGKEVSRQTVDRTPQIWTYRADVIGSLVLTITCEDITRQFTLNVADSDIGIEAETQDLSLYLSSYGRSNNESNPGTWTFGDVQTVFTGFNHSSDGWQLDADNNTVLRVAGDARLTIPYQAFSQDVRTSGKTIELEFATRDVMDYDAVILSCMAGNRGIQLTAQKALLKSEQSEISTQYKEDEHVRISFVVEKRAENRLIYCYINGIMSGTAQYPSDDDFAQAAPVGISIGSNDCTIDLYCIRVYDNDLTRFQLLDNWIADTQNVDEMLTRYQHNNVFDDYGQIVIEQLPKDLPYLVLEGPELPQYKGDKKTVSGSYTDPAQPSNNFTFTGAQANVQGTSSQYYARKNYKIDFKGGFTLADGTTVEDYAMNTDAIPTSTFTFKADVASSEGANNVELVRLYNEADPYRTPPQDADAKVRQGIDGFPIVCFWNNGTETTFLGKYNFNNDKGTPEVFGFTDNDQSWEVLNNTSSRVLWKSADFTGDAWLNDFEARHPEDFTDSTQLSTLAAWLVSTDQEAATGAALTAPVIYAGTEYTVDNAAYRLAKFKAELGDHVELQSACFYYLFTELFLMVDSRAKNMFPSFLGGDKWCFLPYDFDTAIGINNEGALAFSYELEDIDKVAGADVFNGQKSVLWTNLRQAYFDTIKSMYQTLRSTGKLSYADTEQRFETHQAKWPEAVFNEDAYFKYLQPLIDDNSAAYLSMLQGSKAEQRKWWLYNRYRYLDSKYNAGDALSDVITVRGYAKADITVTPYADIYASVKYGSYLVQQRALRGSSYTLECPLDNVNDTEIYIYSASQLKDAGDLSGLMVGYAEFSLATKLQALKLGDASASYSNTNLTELHLGNNVLLKTIDVRNCPNLTQAVDVSGCTNIEHVYFEGTSITGLLLPNGGILKTLHVPATLTNLTIRNQTSLTELTVPSYAGITTLRLENVGDILDTKAILQAIPANSRVRLIGINWEAGTADGLLAIVAVLDTMRGLDEAGNNTDKAQVSGTIHVDTITGAQVAEVQAKYPDLNVTFEHITSTLYFYNYDGSVLLASQDITDGADGSYSGSTPSKPSSAQYSYSFAGWSKRIDGGKDDNALKAVVADRKVYAVFTSTIRKYTVYFRSGNTALQSVNNVPYGGSARYTGTTPVKTGVDDPELYIFQGFDPTGSNITGDTYCYAQYNYIGSPMLSKTWSDGLTSDEKEGVTLINIVNSYTTTGTKSKTWDASYYGNQSVMAYLTDTVVTLVGDGDGKIELPGDSTNIFSSFLKLTNINGLMNLDATKMTTAGNMFYNDQALTTIDLRGWNVSGLRSTYGMFWSCGALTTANLSGWDVSNLINMQDMFRYNYSLTTVDLSGWKAKVKEIREMFEGCNKLTALDLSGIDVSQVQYFNAAFFNCQAFTTLNLNGWDVSNAISLSGILYNCKINGVKVTKQNLTDWNWNLGDLTESTIEWMFRYF